MSTAAASLPDFMGCTIGSHYELDEVLGSGSFGVVYKAMHNDTKQIVAIKQIGASRPVDPEARGAWAKLTIPASSAHRPRRLGRRHLGNSTRNC